MTCTFFGHKDASESLTISLKAALTNLIENYGVNLFYIGNQGNFDFLVIKILDELSKKHPHIRYFIILAYMPKKENCNISLDYEKTIYPEELHKVPLKYAIDKRNRWMLKKADFVITHVKYNFGGAYKFKELAEKCGKTVINILS